MTKRVLLLFLVLPVLLAACTAVAQDEPAENQTTGSTVVVYRSPT